MRRGKKEKKLSDQSLTLARSRGNTRSRLAIDAWGEGGIGNSNKRGGGEERKKMHWLNRGKRMREEKKTAKFGMRVLTYKLAKGKRGGHIQERKEEEELGGGIRDQE